MKSQFLKLFVGVIAVTISAQALAQDSGIVAVLDVKKVFDRNLEFSTKMDEIRSEADRLKAKYQTAQDGLRNDAMKMADLQANSPERKQLESDLAQKQTAMATQARQEENDLLIKEAQAYYETYSKMQEVVKQISQQNNISLVLRFDSAPIDRNNPNDVVVGVNRAIVYHYQLDLTTMVLKNMGPQVEEKAEAPAGTTKR